MEKSEEWELDEFQAACLQIILHEPEAIGVAYKGLDCGCALVCQPVTRDGERPICLKCKADDGLRGRVVRQGIYWPGAAHELPDPELRSRIGRAVFGRDYREDS